MPSPKKSPTPPNGSNRSSPVQVNINLDTTPILYTDNVSMTTNSEGVVLNIMQRLAQNQARIVARIGMSRDHAKKFVTELGRLLAMTEGTGDTSSKPQN